MKEWLSRFIKGRNPDDENAKKKKPQTFTRNDLIPPDEDTQRLGRYFDDTLPSQTDDLEQTLPPFDEFSNEFEVMNYQSIQAMYELIGEKILETQAGLNTDILTMLIEEFPRQSGQPAPQESEELFGLQLLEQMPSLLKAVRTTAKLRLSPTFHKEEYVNAFIDLAMRRHYREWQKKHREQK